MRRRCCMPRPVARGRRWGRAGRSARPFGIGVRRRIAVRRPRSDRRMLLAGPIDGRKMPVGLRDWLDAPVLIGPLPYFTADIQVREETGEKQPGWRSLRTQ